MRKRYGPPVLAAAMGIGLLGDAALASRATAAPDHDGAVVVTRSGPVRGFVTDEYRTFEGIPYAAPPVAENRWASPQPVAPWRTPRDATKPGSPCPQPTFQGEIIGDEDCLTLNVTTPRRSTGRKLPVLVWIHGGGYFSGAGADYGATSMATRGDVVVVTLNYRLGALGFLAHPELNGGKAKNLSGDFGLEDQQAALRWVKSNAAAFGGDQRNVTVAGESSGSRSVCAHLVSPAAAGLFERAILQSEPCTMRDWPGADGSPQANPPGFPLPRAQAEQKGVETAAALGCADPVAAAECLRKIDQATLLNTTAWSFFAPAFGGGVLPADPAEAILAGRFARVPMLHGITRDEYRIADGFREVLDDTETGDPLTDDQFRARVGNFAGSEDRAARMHARYPLENYPNPSEAWATLITDAVFARPTVEFNRALSGRVPTYAFEFADERAPWPSNLDTPSFATGAYHTSELQYLFATKDFERPLDPAQRRLSGQMIDYWARFARTGDPNGPGTPYWPKADRSSRTVQELAPQHIGPVGFSERHHYRFWNQELGGR